MGTHILQPDPKRRPALGKGIESLLGPRPQIAAVPDATGKPLEIALELIERNPHQTRTRFDEAQLAELAQSIAATGVSDEQALEMTIVENLQREDLNPMEQARAFERLSREFKMTQEQMAVRTGKDRASVGNFIRLLKLPSSIQGLVEAGALSFGHARALLALESAERMEAAAAKVNTLAMSVRQTESYVQGLLNPESKKRSEKASTATEAQDPNVREAQDRLQRRLGLKVRIEDKKGKGRVIIEYAGVEDFDAILTALGES